MRPLMHDIDQKVHPSPIIYGGTFSQVLCHFGRQFAHFADLQLRGDSCTGATHGGTRQ